MGNTKENTCKDPKQLLDSISNKPLGERIELITRRLMRLPSVTDTKGEREIADFLFEFLKEFPYFKENSDKVWEQPLSNDNLGRKNIFAFVQGSGSSPNTVIFHAHIDTVGIHDFGSLKEYAYDPDRLEEYYSAHYDPEVREAAQSGKWLFGRGSVDMKSGAAIHLVNLLYFTEHLEKLNGNILLLLNPAEENDHAGIIEASKEFSRLKSEGLHFSVAVNNDYTTSLYEGDSHRYIYTGSAGKVLPCFSIHGREAHVGEILRGIDPTFISSEINRRISCNMDLTEQIEGELVLPPTCLYQRDNKDTYNVQTPPSSRMYFNYFMYETTPKDVMKLLIRETREACRVVKKQMEKQHHVFLSTTQMPFSQHLEWKVDVLSFDEYKENLVQKGISVDDIVKKTVDTYSDLDKRELCFKITEMLVEKDPDDRAKVIIFFAPPFLPCNYLQENSGKMIKKQLLEIVSEEENKSGERFLVKKFFPFLSDSSFLSFPGNTEDVNHLRSNFPAMDEIFPLPIDHIRSLNIPAINIGTYGKDAHKRTERVYKPYTFEQLPRIIRDFTIRSLSL
ncbi:M20/M25/M40 family metallo-hydrolase [Bacillus sp. FJAT-44742]|uniref:M20/M25/M40 family metallo-hydrolase n=1 Tax=Bacillus sp. FJAT-44742 TaxID=2014005 RepID=UPI000C24B03D|nr:M20/M25/M40 family metallo-hydrolase [Bacillus sp. FJAT-44742]